jgi:hypothetical protein
MAKRNGILKQSIPAFVLKSAVFNSN